MKHFDYAGVIHFHSSFSFDGHSPLTTILRAANKNGLDFLMLTDHDHLRARDEGWERWHNNTLLIVGQEISPRFNHYLAFNTRSPIFYPKDAQDIEPQKYIDEVNAQGGFGLIAHPDHGGAPMFHVKHYPWNDWAVTGYKGISVWDFMTDWQSSLQGYFKGLLSFVFPAWFLSGPKPITLSRWDKLNQTQKIIGFGELDNHASIKKFWGITFIAFSFERAFKFISTHVLTDEKLSGDGPEDKEAILQALLAGRAYFALEYFRKARGFTFCVEQEDALYQMGDEFKLGGKALLKVCLPAKALVRVMRNGLLWEKEITSGFSRQVSEPGVYRVEIYLQSYGKLRPWIFSNPIFIR
ncbi:MAG: CehA/McbA family metallohydrolase [Syntrophaceae bacterium]|nr:CehA/McbA family metallohydrolase [Syntrophaceae bacterium]